MYRFALFASLAALLLAACGGGGGGTTGSAPADPSPTQPPSRPPPTTSDPAHHLGTARFTTHQPDVLEQIGAHHAYARGLTGRGGGSGSKTRLSTTRSARNSVTGSGCAMRTVRP